MHKIAALVGGVLVLGLAGVITADLTGYFTIPALGLMYEVTGWEDPSAERAVARTEAALQDENLTAEERAVLESKRAALRDRLLGVDRDPAKKVAKGGKPKAGPERGPDEVGIEEAKGVTQSEHDLTAAIMGDSRKASKAPVLTAPTELQTPNLPDGLTQDSIFEVINKNQRAMSLCISQSMKAGEQLSGRMEVEMSIAATGLVRSASVSTARFSGTTIGNCTVKTVKRWKFPRFNGEPVTVIFPYVLSSTL